MEIDYIKEYSEKFGKKPSEWTYEECLECIGNYGARVYHPLILCRLRQLGKM